MEEKIMTLIDKIIEMLEDDDFQSYLYTNNRFHIVDKDEEIDLEAKLYNNNFYFKDNVNKTLYMFSKNYLDKETTTQKILMSTGKEHFYYSYLERDGFTKLISLIRKEGKDFIKYVDKDLLRKTDKKLIEYANENLSEYSRYGSEADGKMDIKDYAKHYFEIHSSKQDDEYPELDEFDEEDDETFEEDIFDEIDDNDEVVFEEEFDDEEINTVSSAFEGKTISEYKETIDEKAKTYKMVKYASQKEDKKLLLDHYKDVEITVNGKKIQETEKIIMAGDSDVIVEEKYLEAILVNEFAGELKAVLDSKEKYMEYWNENER